ENLDETTTERVELVGVADMAMQADAEKLRQDVKSFDSAVDAITDGNVDKAILTGDGYGRFATMLGQRVERSAAAAAENEADNILHENRPRVARLSRLSCIAPIDVAGKRN